MLPGNATVGGQTRDLSVTSPTYRCANDHTTKLDRSTLMKTFACLVIGAGCDIHPGLRVAGTRGVVRHTQNDQERMLKQPPTMLHRIDI